MASPVIPPQTGQQMAAAWQRRQQPKGKAVTSRNISPNVIDPALVQKALTNLRSGNLKSAPLPPGPAAGDAGFSGMPTADYWKRVRANATPLPGTAGSPLAPDLNTWQDTVYSQQNANAEGVAANRVLNHEGKSLDDYPGAIAWDAYGEPFYGSGFDGLVKKLRGKFYAPVTEYVAPPPLTGADDTIFNRGVRNAEEIGAGVMKALGGEQQEPTTGQVLARVPGALAESAMEVFDVGAKVMGGVGGVAKDMFTLGLEGRLQDMTSAQARASYSSGQFMLLENIMDQIFSDNLKEKEFERRVLAGENADLVASELANPLWQAAQYMLLDPLNFLPTPGKAAKAKQAMEALAMLNRVPAGVDDALKLLGDAKTAERGAEAVKVAAQSVLDARKAVQSGIETLSLKHGAFDLTANGKAARIGSEVGRVIQQVLGGSSEKSLEAIRALTLIASDNLDEVAQGMVILSHMDAPRVLLSEDGLKAGVVLRNMVGDNPKAFLEATAKAAAEGPEKLLAHMDKRMQSVASNLFPDLSKQMEWQKAMDEAAKSGEAVKGVPEFFAKAYKEGRRISPAAMTAVNWHNKAQKVYGPFNTFFSNMYMNFSLPYAFRNGINNAFTTMVDQGPRAFRTADGAKAVLKKYGVTPANVGGLSGSGGTMGVGKAPKLGFSALASKMEEWSALQVAAAATERTMKQYLRTGVAIPDIKGLVAAGVDKRSAEMLTRLIADNHGDVEAALKVWEKAVGSGRIDLLTTTAWMTPELRELLSKPGLEMVDEVQAIAARARAEGKTLDEALAEVDKLYTDMAKAGTAPGAPAGLDPDVVPEEVINSMEAARQSGVFSQAKLQDLSYHGGANSAAVEAAKSILEELAQTNPEARRLLDNFNANAPRISQQVEMRRTAVAAADLLARSASDKRIDIAKVINELPPAIVPVTPLSPSASRAEFRNWLWADYFFPSKDKLYNDSRDELFRGLAALPVQNREALAQAQKLYGYAKNWDAVLRDDLVRPALDAARALGEKGNATAARVIANQFGFETTVEQAVGMPRARADLGKEIGADNHLLNLINKNLPEGMEKYKSLDEADPAVVKAAFIRKMQREAGLPETVAQAAPEVQAAAEAAPAARVKSMSEEDRAESLGRLRKTPLSQIKNNELAAMVREIAKGLMNETWEGEPARRLLISDPSFNAGEDKWIKIGNTFYRWVNDMFKTGEFRGRSEISRALKSIINGKDYIKKDMVLPENERRVLRGVDKMKNEIIGRLALGYTDELGAMDFPPNPHFWMLMGDEQKALEAFSDWADMPNVGEDTLRAIVGNEDSYKFLEDLYVRQAGGEPIETALGGAADVAVDVFKPYKLPPTPKPPVMRADVAAAPTLAQAGQENAAGIRKVLDMAKDELRNNWGRVEFVNPGKGDPAVLNQWVKEAKDRVGTARLAASKVADEARKFTLLNYGEKTGFDLALAYIFPYSFWYTRSYTNWMKRIVQDPRVLSNYMRYKTAMQRIHADQPDWWKQNLNTNELLGLDAENPLYFNIEALLNPLNGLLGVDFNDPNKRVNWWTKTVDDLNKFGPSTWTPYSWAIAAALWAQGEEDAASRWAGRLVPQTTFLKNALSLMNVNVKTRQGVNEFDPMVHIFSGGMDPYERRRVGRYLGGMVDSGQTDAATAIEAARTQEGPVWQQAAEGATRQRAGNWLTFGANFIGGVGLKARSQSDMQIDQFDREWRAAWAAKDYMTADQFRETMDALRVKYPWGDTVLLSRKAGADRDRSYAYNVLSRIPPGQSDAVLEAVGLDPELAQIFWNNKGDLSTLSETEQARFMAGMVDIGAVLDLPDKATRAEWRTAKSLFDQMKAQMKINFGADIEDKLTTYYNLPYDDDYAARNAYLDANPDVNAALRFQDEFKMSDPTMQQYYMGLDKIEKYYNSLMWDDIEKQLGADIWQTQEDWYEQKLISSAAGKAFRKAHPELDQYTKLAEEWRKKVANAMLQAGDLLRDPTFPQIRQDAGVSRGEQGLMEMLQTPTDRGLLDLTWEEISAEMSPALERLVLDYVNNGDELSYEASNQLDYIADQFGISTEALLRIIELRATP